MKPRPIWREPAFAKIFAAALAAEIGFAVVNLSSMTLFLTRDARYSELQAALCVTVFLGAESVLKGPLGMVAERKGGQMLIRIGMAVPLITSLLCLLLPNRPFALMLGLRAADGAAAAALWPALYAGVGAQARDDQKSEAMSLLNTCYLGGIAAAFAIGGLLDDLLGPALAGWTGRYSGGLWAGVTLFAGLLLFARIPIGTPPAHEAGPRGRVPFGYLALGALAFFGIGLPTGIFKLAALDVYGLSSGQFGAVALPGVMVLAFLSLVGARWSEGWGRERSVKFGLLLCVLGLGWISLGLLLPAWRLPYVGLLGALPAGFGFILAIPGWLAAVGDLDPTRRAGNLGLVMAAQGVGAAIGAPVGGWLYHWNPLLPFAATAGALLAALAVAGVILRSR